MTGAPDAATSALSTTVDKAADAGHAAIAATQPVVDTVTDATSAVANTIQPVTDSLEAAAQPVIDATARTADAVATTADPVVQTVASAGQPVVQTIDAAAQPVVHATAEAAGTLAAAAQPLGDAAAAVTQPAVQTLANAAQPFVDTGGHVAATVEPLAQTLGASAHSLTAALGDVSQQFGEAAATHPAVEGTAHAGTVIAAGIDSGATAAASAAGSGGMPVDLPPLDPTTLRYLGLAGLVVLTMQAAVRWTNAAGGCVVPSLALRQFRLLPCMAVGSIERLAHTALAVGAGPSSAGTAGQSASRSRLPRAGSRTEPSSGNRATARDGSSSGAIQAVQIVLLTALILVNVILVAIRDTVRRNNGA